MRGLCVMTAAAMLSPALAGAHITVRPRESKPGIVERHEAPGATHVQAADGGPAAPQGGDTAAIEAWLRGYDAAFNARDLDRLGTFYHPEVTIYEGGGVNNGWADYRDNHLEPELRELQNLQFSHANTRVHLLEGGRAAYVTSSYAIKGRLGEREIDAGGLETLVVVKDASGSWKIRHSHTSSRPRRP